ncbi:MAG: hypothetical protein K2M17_05750 [Bacilli bacterium]|nr:hypothetical protein [Bacilli bacterium]
MELKTLTATKLTTTRTKVVDTIEFFPWGLKHKMNCFYSIEHLHDRSHVTHERRYMKSAQTDEQKENIIKRIEKRYDIKFNRN